MKDAAMGLIFVALFIPEEYSNCGLFVRRFRLSSHAVIG